jgi:hypothetical protein
MHRLAAAVGMPTNRSIAEPGTRTTGPVTDRRPLTDQRGQSQLRFDRQTGQWIIVAALRQDRTHIPTLAECPLCPGPSGLTSEVQDHGPSALEAVTDPVAARRARHILTENQRVLDFVAALGDSDFAEAGRILVSSHASMRDAVRAAASERGYPEPTVSRTHAGRGAHG